jgi:hypothetical protein
MLIATMQIFRRSVQWVRIISLAGVIAMAACGGGQRTEPQTGPSQEPEPTEPQQQAEQSAAASEQPVTQAPPEPEPPKEPTVTLVEAGAEPRTELRYAPKAKQKERLRMLMDLKLVTQIDGQARGVVVPRMQIDMNLQISSVAANGDIDYDLELMSAKAQPTKDVPAEAMKALSAELKKVEGLKGHGTMDARGITKSFEIGVPKSIDPMVKQTLDQLSTAMQNIANPFPTEPVGVGAKWDVKVLYMQQGMRLEQVNHATLEAKKGNQLTVRMQIEQTAKPQPVPLSSLPDATAHLLSLRTRGTALSKNDLRKLVPVSADFDMKIQMKVKVSESKSQKTHEVISELTMRTLMTNK